MTDKIDTTIELEDISGIDGKSKIPPAENAYTLPLYIPPQQQNQYPQKQNYYYSSDPNYPQGYAPAYNQSQRAGGQPVYVAGQPPPPPPRGTTTVYIINEPPPEDNYYYGNQQMFTSAFDTVRIRNRFVQRVYTILSVQLFVTFGFIILAIYEKHMAAFFKKYALVLLIVSMILFLTLYITLVCCDSLRRSYPTNFFLLGLLTVCMTILLATLSVFAHTNIVMYAIGTTALVCFLVSIFAIQTSWDVTGCGMCLCIATMVLMIFGLIITIMHFCGLHFKVLDMVYASIATLLFCFYLMYDTQQIVGGRRIEMSPEEYIYGALCLYIDIAYIFMHILTLYELCLGGS